MIDVDHFKNVNDTYGHHAGDDVLRAVSEAIRTVHNGTGLVCRYGGEEFCVVLPNTDLETANERGELTRAAIAEIRLLDPADLRLTASVGVSEMRFNPSDPQDFINQADTCLYVAKREGRNRVISYNPILASTPEVSQEIEESKRDQVKISYRTVTALITALSYRDANTAEHSRRVADLCARSASGILDPADTYLLEIAALLHDVGKIGVPDSILLKPGPLTDAEWECMGRHDRISAEIINNAFECPELTEIVSRHHSALQVSGNGDTKIASMSARLLAIADSYDAMVSDRVYRKGRSHNEAIAELRRCAGTQFDAELVEHFASSVTMTTPEVASGALAIRKQAAIQIGQQIELIADAVANEDIDSLYSLASDLHEIAGICHIDSIVVAAEKIESDATKEDSQWGELLRDTHDLLDTCRHAQTEFLKSTLELESDYINQ
jgi:diguanylate cyclase (GGDEF)-like protein/putative nucleotidyltransferase with HDIG domain